MASGNVTPVDPLPPTEPGIVDTHQTRWGPRKIAKVGLLGLTLCICSPVLSLCGILVLPYHTYRLSTVKRWYAGHDDTINYEQRKYKFYIKEDALLILPIVNAVFTTKELLSTKNNPYNLAEFMK